MCKQKNNQALKAHLQVTQIDICVIAVEFWHGSEKGISAQNLYFNFLKETGQEKKKKLKNDGFKAAGN